MGKYVVVIYKGSIVLIIAYLILGIGVYADTEVGVNRTMSPSIPVTQASTQDANDKTDVNSTTPPSLKAPGTTSYKIRCSQNPPTFFNAQVVSLESKYRVASIRGICSGSAGVAKTRVLVSAEKKTIGYKVISMLPIKVVPNTKLVTLSSSKTCRFNLGDTKNNVVTFFVDSGVTKLRAVCGSQEKDNNQRIQDNINSADGYNNSLNNYGGGQGYNNNNGLPPELQQSPEQAAVNGDTNQPYNSEQQRGGGLGGGNSLGGGQGGYDSQPGYDPGARDPYQDYLKDLESRGGSNNIGGDWATGSSKWLDAGWTDGVSSADNISGGSSQEVVQGVYGGASTKASVDSQYDVLTPNSKGGDNTNNKSDNQTQQIPQFALDDNYSKILPNRDTFYFDAKSVDGGADSVSTWLENNKDIKIEDYSNIDWTDYSKDKTTLGQKYPGWENDFASGKTLEEIRYAYPKVTKDEYDIMGAIYAQNHSSWAINLNGDSLPPAQEKKKKSWIYKILIGWYWDPIKQFFNPNVSI